jgi:hypothetical protein
MADGLKGEEDMDLDQAVEIVQRFKALPEPERQGVIADPASPYHEAKALGARFLAKLSEAEEAERLRKSRVQSLTTTLNDSARVLARMDVDGVIDISDARRIAAFDETITGLAAALGAACPVLAVDYGAAVAAWVRGESSVLAATRQAQRDAMLGALKP